MPQPTHGYDHQNLDRDPQLRCNGKDMTKTKRELYQDRVPFQEATRTCCSQTSSRKMQTTRQRPCNGLARSAILPHRRRCCERRRSSRRDPPSRHTLGNLSFTFIRFHHDVLSDSPKAILSDEVYYRIFMTGCPADENINLHAIFTFRFDLFIHIFTAQVFWYNLRVHRKEKYLADEIATRIQHR